MTDCGCGCYNSLSVRACAVFVAKDMGKYMRDCVHAPLNLNRTRGVVGCDRVCAVDTHDEAPGAVRKRHEEGCDVIVVKSRVDCLSNAGD